ncbi:MAG TPA: DUF3465 domain-containing protein [Pyrinomonadaceae bacterium]|nr:DUF3465 domain-containing protein [Pyrinomonadaceae bacterium]
MHRLTKLLLLAVLLCLLPSVATAQKSTRKTRKPSSPAVICKIESVPNGMVVVGYKRNSACSNGAELLVARPENGDIICAESPVPAGFSIASEAQGPLVGTCPNKAFLITGAAPATEQLTAVDDDPIARAFANRESDVQVEGEGTVTRLLPDDLNGSRHQRFIVQLASGQTLLISHNIDLAPRIDALAVGDSVRFNGEYVWNEKGGVIHWTHHDPRGRHVAGWVVHNGKTYK